MINRDCKNIIIAILIVSTLNLWGQNKEDSYIFPNKYNNTLNLSDKISITKDISIEGYFSFIDSVVSHHNSNSLNKITEHLLVRANSWIIDTLRNTDYYRMRSRDSFVYNQKKMIAIPKGSKLNIPDSIKIKELNLLFNKTSLDVNIPEYRLRIFEDSILLFEFPIRVGKNENKYLEMSGRIEDLRTKTGQGVIIKHIRNPRYINPVNNHEYYVTRRDDDNITALPLIPFIETEINGLRYGQLIHPTTNPETLGKAYSNGCIGIKEADAWVIYYYSPLDTKINIRYDLNVISNKGDTLILRDIYGRSTKN